MDDARRNSIKTLTRIFYDYQRERMSLDGRLGITKKGEKKKKAPERDMSILIDIKKRRDDVFAMEEMTAKMLAKEVHQHPLWKAFLCEAKGVGESIAAVIISEFDIYKAPTVSNMWSFAGLNPGMVKGKKRKKDKIIITDELVRGDRKTPGFVCPFNQFLRSKLCGVLGPSFLKCNSPYREHYDNMKHRLESADWGMASKNPVDKKRPKAGHQHRAANRYMIKMFLIDLYVAWRILEKLPVRGSYQEEYLGFKHATQPEQAMQVKETTVVKRATTNEKSIRKERAKYIEKSIQKERIIWLCAHGQFSCFAGGICTSFDRSLSVFEGLK